MPTAWWVNFGSYVRGAEGDAPYLVGFTGFGTLGGGNLSMRTGGDAGNIAPRGDGSIPSSGNLNPRSQGLVLAVAGTGRLTSDGALQLGGGGDLNVRIGGEVNPSREARATQTYSSSGFDGLYSGGTIHDLQGPSSICAVPRACTVVRWEALILATTLYCGTPPKCAAGMRSARRWLAPRAASPWWPEILACVWKPVATWSWAG